MTDTKSAYDNWRGYLPAGDGEKWSIHGPMFGSEVRPDGPVWFMNVFWWEGERRHQLGAHLEVEVPTEDQVKNTEKLIRGLMRKV